MAAGCRQRPRGPAGRALRGVRRALPGPDPGGGGGGGRAGRGRCAREVPARCAAQPGGGGGGGRTCLGGAVGRRALRLRPARSPLVPRLRLLVEIIPAGGRDVPFPRRRGAASPLPHRPAATRRCLFCSASCPRRGVLRPGRATYVCFRGCLSAN